jgi:hypothetical protein
MVELLAERTPILERGRSDREAFDESLYVPDCGVLHDTGRPLGFHDVSSIGKAADRGTGRWS